MESQGGPKRDRLRQRVGGSDRQRQGVACSVRKREVSTGTDGQNRAETGKAKERPGPTSSDR